MFEQRVRQFLRRPAGLRNVGEGVERTFGHAAGKPFDLVQAGDEGIAAALEFGAHFVDGGLVAAQGCDSGNLDMHAAPGGQTGRNIDDSERDQPELFLNPLHWKKAVMLWKAIAERYKDESTVLAYDILNEPLPEEGQFIALTNQLEPFYKEVTASIRESDSNHIITLEGARWATDWTIFGKPFDKNLLYQFHKYWNATDQASIQTYLDFSKKWDVPVWCGETGENNIKWYRESFGLLEKNRIGWAFWTWKRLENANSTYSITQPSYWGDITGAASYGTKCAPEKAELILSNFLENCRIENCQTNDFVIKAVLLK